MSATSIETTGAATNYFANKQNFLLGDLDTAKGYLNALIAGADIDFSAHLKSKNLNSSSPTAFRQVAEENSKIVSSKSVGPER